MVAILKIDYGLELARIARLMRYRPGELRGRDWNIVEQAAEMLAGYTLEVHGPKGCGATPNEEAHDRE